MRVFQQTRIPHCASGLHTGCNKNRDYEQTSDESCSTERALFYPRELELPVQTFISSLVPIPSDCRGYGNETTSSSIQPLSCNRRKQHSDWLLASNISLSELREFPVSHHEGISSTLVKKHGFCFEITWPGDVARQCA